MSHSPIHRDSPHNNLQISAHVALELSALTVCLVVDNGNSRKRIWKQIRQTHGQAAIGIVEWENEMNRNLFVVLYIVVMIAVIVGVDVLFFRGQNRTWERLMVNIGIVLVDAAFYLRFLKNL